MNWKIILKIQGLLLIILALMMSFSLIFSIYYNQHDTRAILYSIGITLLSGVFFSLAFKSTDPIKPREAFLVVVLGWVFASIYGALPFYFDGSAGSFINCVFESMSGFSTTGATILTDIDIVPKGILFWRSMTHWLGGMGIVLLTIAILPMLGVSSGQLYNAEVPGPTKERISPKIKDTAKILWMIYTGLTVLQTIFLMIGGMTFFDAICHSFGTVATGGFSTTNRSVAGYNSLYIEIVILIFMYLAGISFVLHFKLLTGNIKYFFRDNEWRFYTGVIIISIIFISLYIYITATYSSPVDGVEISGYRNNFALSLRDAAFTVVSIITTTGFTTANFNVWPPFAGVLLILLSFSGGCAGSTGGGMKQVRIMIILKKVANEIKKLARPKAVLCVRVGKEAVSENIVRSVSAFFILFILLYGLITLFLSFMGYDIITSLSASVATLGNIGPGLGRVGAIENYAFFDPFSKVVLIFAMMLGRLEIYSVLILFYAFFNRD